MERVLYILNSLIRKLVCWNTATLTEKRNSLVVMEMCFFDEIMEMFR